MSTTYRRTADGFGYLSDDAEFFLERQGRMQGGNTNGWVIYRRTPPQFIATDNGSHFYDSRDGVTLTDVEGILYGYVGDEGSFGDAKHAVTYYRERVGA